MVEKIFAGILVDRVYRVTEGLFDDVQRRFQSGRRCVDQIFTIKYLGEKVSEKKQKMYVNL